MDFTHDLFSSSNSIGYIAEEEYQSAESLIRVFESISKVTYPSLYIADYYKNNFLYVSNNPLFLCNQSAEQVKEAGYRFYFEHIPRKEYEMIMEINRAAAHFFSEIPVQEKKDYTLSYDFHLINKKHIILINHKLTPLALSKEGKVWLVTCVVSLSSHTMAGHIELRKTGQSIYWKYSLESHRWIEKECIMLNEKEKSILLLSAQGYTMNEISERLFLAVDTVKFYKRQLFGKLDVKNIIEALSFATNHKLF